MKNSNNKLNLFIGNFVLVALLVAALVCYWVPRKPREFNACYSSCICGCNWDFRLTGLAGLKAQG